MNRYWKLVHMEIHRFRYVLAALMGITAVFQTGAVLVYVQDELRRRDDYLELYGKLPESLGPVSFARASSEMWFWFALPVAVAIGVLVFYAFFIWYRDWLGRDTFIYRLLTLPTARRHVYLAKLTALLTFVFAMLAWQLLLLPLEKWLFTMLMPSKYVEVSYIAEAIEENRVLMVLLPRNFDFFLVSYGIGILAVLVAFAAILLERSYRLAGIALGLLYVAACAVLVVIPLFYFAFESSGGFFYPEEVLGITLLTCACVGVLSVWISFRLLAKKVSV